MDINYNDFKTDIDNAILSMRKDISILKEQIKLIESIEEVKEINEDIWHKFCETPLRYSTLLSEFVKQLFPEAENIRVGCNNVDFEYMGFKIQIPTSRCLGINIDTSWYERDRGLP